MQNQEGPEQVHRGLDRRKAASRRFGLRSAFSIDRRVADRRSLVTA